MYLNISENLKEQRKKKDNTQEDLADFLDVSVSAGSKWERGDCVVKPVSRQGIARNCKHSINFEVCEQ